MPGRPHLTRRFRARFAVLATTVGLIAACTDGVVTVTPPQPSGQAIADCADLIAALPAELDGLSRRATVPDGPTAAYGSPAATVRCGVPEPAALGATSQLLTVDDVDWFGEELTAGTRFTTVGRSAYLEVDVPTPHAPAADLLVDLAPAVTAELPLTAESSPAD